MCTLKDSWQSLSRLLSFILYRLDWLHDIGTLLFFIYSFYDSLGLFTCKSVLLFGRFSFLFLGIIFTFISMSVAATVKNEVMNYVFDCFFIYLKGHPTI